MDALNRTGICRLCADVKDSFLRIFDEEGYKLAIGIKINKYLQIQVDEKDSLPKNVCWDCYSKLEQCSNFVNNSQNAQITLSQKIFAMYDDQSLMKEENVFTQDAIFHQSTNLLNFGSQQMEKPDKTQPTFSCSDMNVTDSNPSCYFSNKPADCLFEEQNKTISEISHVSDTNDINTASCSSSIYNFRKKALQNKNKNINIVRNMASNLSIIRSKRKVNRKKKIVNTKRRKHNAIGQTDEEDYCEDESVIFKEKYFNNIPWMCTACEDNFQTLNELQNHHENYHLQATRYMCPYCYKVYMQYQGFVTHLKKHQCTSEFSCDQCSKVFTSKRLFTNHVLIHSEKRQYQCKDCGKSFRQQSGLSLHNRSHRIGQTKNEFTCDQCDKSFSTKPNLVTHKKIHTGLRNYTCDLCGKSFVQKGNLCAHMLTHSDNKPFTCETCHKEFKSPMQLRKHNNIHIGKKPHQCDICGRTFRERNTLKEHYRIHTGAMPFSCDYCGKAFRFKGVLTTHRRQHTGERPYSCAECQHHFTNWPNYNKHMKRRHGIIKNQSGPIKSDSVQNNSHVSEESMDNNNSPPIDEIPSFEDTLQPVVIDGDKTVRLFEESQSDNHLTSSSYLISQQNYSSMTSVQQNSILNSYYNINGLQMMNPPSHSIDIMNRSMHR